VDPARAEQLREIRRRYPPARLPTHPISVVRRTGKPILLREVTEDAVRAAVMDEAHAAMVRDVTPKSMMYVPVAARGHVLGVLSCGAAGRPLDDADLDLASELARRAALAIDNARLYEHSLRTTRGRDEVLGVVSHDLRNPLSTINMCAGALLDPEPPTVEGTRSMAEIIQRSTDWMQRIIRDLLDVTSIEAGRLALDRYPLAPASVLESARELMALQTEDAGIALDVRGDDALPPIEADHERVVQVLLNLIGNAVKFTPAGGRVTVRAEAAVGGGNGSGNAGDGPRGDQGQQKQQQHHVRFSVGDTGPGIPAEHLDHIFDRFWQVRAQGRAGAGLGLAIAKGIVEAHGGAIGVTSTVGVGTTFWFTIPAARRGAPQLPPDAPRKAALSSTKSR
jgi:signal transduction histidine kinase